MTRLPSGTFFPVGAFPENEIHISVNGNSAPNVVSPLNLPGSLRPNGHLDPHQSSLTGPPHPSYAHPSYDSHVAPGESEPVPLAAAMDGNHRSSRAYPPLSHPPHFLSPTLGRTGAAFQYQQQRRHPQQRSASLSPTRRATAATNITPRRVRIRSAMQSPEQSQASNSEASSSAPRPDSTRPEAPFERPVRGFINMDSAMSDPPMTFSPSSVGQPRSLSADIVEVPSSPQMSSPQMVQRLVQQNARMREAWEAERKHMEANRERAETVYKEERALMDEERAAWLLERGRLMEEISFLRQQVYNGGGPRIIVTTNPSSRPNASTQGLRGGGWDTAPESLRSSESSLANTQMSQNADSSHASGPSVIFQDLGPGPPVQSEKRGDGRIHLAPAKYDDSPPPFPGMEPREDPRGSDPVASGALPVPTIDVQEIHPELDGIPIKAKAIHTPTFKDAAITSPPPGAKPPNGKPSPPSEPVSPEAKKSRRRSKEQTLQMLAVDETDRLTMHAGHTPNHSVTYLPTMTASDAATVATSTGTNSPVMQGQADGAGSHEEHRHPADGHSKGKNRRENSKSEQAPPEPGPSGHGQPKNLRPIYEEDPEDPPDRPLKGPLMVRNQPAHDEVFFRRLSDKLTEVSRGHDAIPAALKDLRLTSRSPEKTKALVKSAFKKATRGKAGGDGAADAAEKGPGRVRRHGRRDSKSDDEEDEEEDMEIPLRLKKSNNFGAPFGEFRG